MVWLWWRGWLAGRRRPLRLPLLAGRRQLLLQVVPASLLMGSTPVSSRNIAEGGSTTTFGSLRVRRERHLTGSLREWAVVLDGQFAAWVHAGQTVALRTSPGHHVLSVSVGSSTQVSTDVKINAGEAVDLVCSPSHLLKGSFFKRSCATIKIREIVVTTRPPG